MANATQVNFDGEDLRVVVQAIEETADIYEARAEDSVESAPGAAHEWKHDARRLRDIHARMAKLAFDIDKGGACETQTWSFKLPPDAVKIPEGSTVFTDAVADYVKADIIIDSAWLLKFVEAKATALVDTVRRKNADYSGAAPDPFGNFRNVEDLGIATVEQGFLTRMTDKLARAASLTKPGKTAQVKDESVEDTLFDLAAYSFLLAAYRASKRLSEEGRTLP